MDTLFEHARGTKRENMKTFFLGVVLVITLTSFGCGPSEPPTVTTSSTRVTTTAPAIKGNAQEWYEEGLYMGFWAGNVEIIPSNTGDLPDFFFSGPTPSAPIRTDGEGNPLQQDPAAIKKPLWVFGDELQIGDHLGEIRQAKMDGRPVLFYATSVSEAASALQSEQQVGTDSPLERLIVFWLPWDRSTLDAVGTYAWTGASNPPEIFLMLVNATLELP